MEENPETGAEDCKYLPHFLGIGAQKAGTTWLHHNLRAHHNAFLPKEKELHFFDRKFGLDLKVYSDYFESGADKIRGEITPAYSILSSDHIGYIRKYLPNARILFIMRNPIDRAWSHALMSLVRKSRRSYADIPPSEFLGHFTHRESTERGDYPTILRKWYQHYPKEQIFVGFFEDIVERPKQFLMTVFQYLGLSTDVNWMQFPLNQIFHKGTDIPITAMFRETLIEIYEPKIRSLAPLYGERVLKWLSD